MKFKQTLIEFLNSTNNQLVVNESVRWEEDGVVFCDVEDNRGLQSSPFTLVKRRLGQYAYLLYAIDNGHNDYLPDGEGRLFEVDRECYLSCENGRLSPEGKHDVMAVMVYSPGRKERFLCWTHFCPESVLGHLYKYIETAFEQDDMMPFSSHAHQSAQRLNDKYLSELYTRYSEEEILDRGGFDLNDSLPNVSSRYIYISSKTGTLRTTFDNSPDLLEDAKRKLQSFYLCDEDCDITAEEMDRFYSYENEEQYIDDVLQRLLALQPQSKQFDPHDDPAAAMYSKHLRLSKALAESGIGQKVKDIASAVSGVTAQTVEVQSWDNTNRSTSKSERIPVEILRKEDIDVELTILYNAATKTYCDTIHDGKIFVKNGKYLSINNIKRIISRGKVIYNIEFPQEGYLNIGDGNGLPF